MPKAYFLPFGPSVAKITYRKVTKHDSRPILGRTQYDSWADAHATLLYSASVRLQRAKNELAAAKKFAANVQKMKAEQP